MRNGFQKRKIKFLTMFLGDANKKIAGVPAENTTTFTQIGELNKKLRILTETVNNNICELRELNQREFDQTQGILTTLLGVIQNEVVNKLQALIDKE